MQHMQGYCQFPLVMDKLTTIFEDNAAYISPVQAEIVKEDQTKHMPIN